MILDNSLVADLPPVPGRLIFQWDTDGEQLQSMFLPVDQDDKPEKDPEQYPLARDVISHVGEVEMFHDSEHGRCISGV